MSAWLRRASTCLYAEKTCSLAISTYSIQHFGPERVYQEQDLVLNPPGRDEYFLVNLGSMSAQESTHRAT
jgi:hypothetical protein